MGRNSVDEFWLKKINELTANFPKLGPKAAAQRFEKDRDCAARDDWPSESTIGRYQRKFRQKDSAEQVGYRWLHWPESFDEGALPWEAAAATLELLRFLREKKMGRPCIMLSRWYWRLTLAAPDAPIADRFGMALLLHDDARHWPEAIEGWLVGGPWRSEAAAAAFEATRQPLIVKGGLT